MSEHLSEWAWAKSGGMMPFLENASNWKNGLSLDNYKQSVALQDGAFKINADGTYHRAIKQGVLEGDDNPLRIAGFFLKKSGSHGRLWCCSSGCQRGTSDT